MNHLELDSAHPPKKQKAAIYLRVSTSEQNISGYGLEMQKNRVIEYIKNNSALNAFVDEESIFIDVHTGAELNRPGLTKLLDACKKGKFSSVIVWKIDRLSRSLKHLLEIFEEFQAAGVSFVSVQENINFNGAIGNLIFQIFGAIAQFERSLLKTRTLAGKIASAEMGNFTGSKIPFGYDPQKNKSGKGKTLKLNEKEQNTVQEIFEWYVYDKLSLPQIAEKLTSLKIPTSRHRKKKNPNKWTSRMLEKMLSNSIYRGEFVANKKDENNKLLPTDQWTITAIPACVDEILFSMAQERRKERAKGYLASNYVYLLTSKMVDVSIKYPRTFVGIKRTKGGYSYRRKTHINRDGNKEGVFEIAAEPIEKVVWKNIKEALNEPEVFINTYFDLKKVKKTGRTTTRNKLAELRSQKANTALEIDRIEKAYIDGVFDIDKMKLNVAEAQEREVHINQQIKEIEEEVTLLSTKESEIAKLKKMAKSFKYNLENFDRASKKLLIDIFIERVEINREAAGKQKNGRTKWRKSIKVFFRFNPDLLVTKAKGGRTRKPSDKTSKSDSKDKKNGSGGLGGTGCTRGFGFSSTEGRVAIAYLLGYKTVSDPRKKVKRVCELINLKKSPNI